MKKLFDWLIDKISPPVVLRIMAGTSSDGKSVTIDYLEYVETRLPLPVVGDRIFFKNSYYYVLWITVDVDNNLVEIAASRNDPKELVNKWQ